jgi:hypothetical protein
MSTATAATASRKRAGLPAFAAASAISGQICTERCVAAHAAVATTTASRSTSTSRTARANRDRNGVSQLRCAEYAFYP